MQRRFNVTETNLRFVLEYICKNQLAELFTNTIIAIRILLTFPVMAATGEGNFSKLFTILNVRGLLSGFYNDFNREGIGHYFGYG